MNSERELFEDHYKKLFGDIGFDYLKSDGSYSNDRKNNMWLSWQASTNRKGYKLVPVNVSEKMIDAVDQLPDGCTINEIYEAMIGTVDE